MLSVFIVVQKGERKRSTTEARRLNTAHSDMSALKQLETASMVAFRDPSGRLMMTKDRVLRLVNAEGAADVSRFLASGAFTELSRERKLVGTSILDAAEKMQVIEHAKQIDRANTNQDVAIVLEHERIPFPSFPYEWPPEMLLSAARLTLDIAERLLKEGLGLKDASPYNILFCGSQPVFVDFLSFEPRDGSDPMWLPQAQFIRNFVLPLLLNQRLQLPLDQIFMTRRDGLEPLEVYRMLTPFQRLTPPYLEFVTIPSWLEHWGERQKDRLYQPKQLNNPEQAGFILQRQFKRLRRGLNNVCPRQHKQSAWTHYMDDALSYTGTQFEAKHAFVERVGAEIKPKCVLDVGCNTGHFSLMMAKLGARVVAVDADAAVVGEVWRRAEKRGLDILPLVANLARPSPALGWKNGEWPSLLDRLQGQFDLVLMLAVIHHLLVSERVPLDEILKLVAELTCKDAVIEFVGCDDPMFQHLCRGREHLFADLTRAGFEEACSYHFDVVHVQRIEGASRWLYCLRKRST